VLATTAFWRRPIWPRPVCRRWYCQEQALVGGNTITGQLPPAGYHHDWCSSAHVLVQSNPPIRDDELGLRSLGLPYVHTDPAVVLPFADGSGLVAHRDAERTAIRIARWGESDVAAFLRLLADWQGGRPRPGVHGSAGAAGGCRLRACRRAPGGVERRAHVRATRGPTLRGGTAGQPHPTPFCSLIQRYLRAESYSPVSGPELNRPGRCGEPAGPLGHHGPGGLDVRRCPPAVRRPGGAEVGTRTPGRRRRRPGRPSPWRGAGSGSSGTGACAVASRGRRAVPA
jgi:hypothetical protein